MTDFFDAIDEWQLALARDIAARNPDVTSHALNDAVQRAIVRGLFLRLAEPCGASVFDDFLPALLPNGDAFTALPIDTLSRAYERLLGKPVRLTPARRVKIEDKPGIKKAGGVFYTPGYIVHYIVRNTVGRWIENNAAAIRELPLPRTLRVLDMACGGGTFLLGAYQYLLDYCLRWYVEHRPAKHIEAVWQPLSPSPSPSGGDSGEEWRLTTAEKKRILTTHIFGVDVDPGAVEVARLSLLLKMLEGASGDKRDGSLPDLSENIQCGNSLLGTDYAGPGALDWASEGLFDCIIGNPPYGAELRDGERKYLARKFNIGTTDTAALMMLRARQLTTSGGWNGFIVPKPFTYSSNWKRVREMLLDELCELVDAGRAWKEVKLEQVVYLLRKGYPTQTYRSYQRVGQDFKQLATIPKTECARFGFYLNGIDAAQLAIGCKVTAQGRPLGEFVTNARGAMLQGSITQAGQGRRVIGGKQLQRYAICGQKGYLAPGASLPPNALARRGSILVQNIVAHITRPVDHIQIIGTLAGGDAGHVAVLDTVNQLTNRSDLSSHYLLGLLHSRLINWYVYRFIFAKAIRTMHFDGPVSDRIPMRPIDRSRAGDRAGHDEIARLVRQAMALSRPSARSASASHKLIAIDQALNVAVYRLYGLTGAEIAVIESAFGQRDA